MTLTKALPTVLVATNLPEIHSTLEALLQNQGYTLHLVNDGQAALESLQKSKPDAIVVSNELSGLSGVDFCRLISESHEMSQIPIVMLLEAKAIKTKQLAKKWGVSYFVNTPIEPTEFIDQLKLATQSSTHIFSNATIAHTLDQGTLANHEAAELLRELEEKKRSALFSLSNPIWGTGTVSFRDGHIVSAQTHNLSGPRAIYRFLMWDSGDYTIEDSDITTSNAIGLSAGALIMEGLRRQEEATKLLKEIGSPQRWLNLNHEKIERILPNQSTAVCKFLDSLTTEAFQLGHTVCMSPLGDLETLVLLQRLNIAGGLVAAPAPSPALEQETLPDIERPGQISSIQALDTPAKPQATTHDTITQFTTAPPAAPPVRPSADQNPSTKKPIASTTSTHDFQTSDEGFEDIQDDDLLLDFKPNYRRYAIFSLGAVLVLSALAFVLSQDNTDHASFAQTKTDQENAKKESTDPSPVTSAKHEKTPPRPNVRPNKQASKSLTPRSKTKQARPTVKMFINKGRQLTRQGQWHEALDELKNALALEPGNALVHKYLGEAYFNIEDNALALKHLQRALKLKPELGPAWVILGNVHQALHQIEDAKEAYKRYLVILPDGRYAADIKLILSTMP
jgi:CheY-like chemotaxis protein